MKAIRVHEFGGPEVLRFEEVPTPQPGRGEVLVRMYAIGVNPVEIYVRAGTCRQAMGIPAYPVFLSPLGRGLISSLLCVLLGHVFALSRRAVKSRAFPVVNTCLGVNPHLAMASAGRGRVCRFLSRAPCRRWSCGRRRFLLSLRFLGSGFCFRRSRW
jgi:hypothetical protein